MRLTSVHWKVAGFAVAGAALAGAGAYALYHALPDISTLGAAAGSSTPGFQETVAWVMAGGYALIFFGMVVEGPMVTTAAAFAASLGYFNIWVVMLFAAMADFLADLGFYIFGHFSRLSVLEKHGHKVGFTQERLEKVEHLLHTHPRKTILFLKLLPGAAVVGLPIVGAMRVPLRTYATTVLSFIIPSVILFGSLGYFFGETYEQASMYLHDAKIVLIVGVLIILAVYYLYRRWTAKIAKQLERTS